jgi:hypothetical protein
MGVHLAQVINETGRRCERDDLALADWAIVRQRAAHPHFSSVVHYQWI